MSDSYVLALENERETRMAQLERCRSEVARFAAEVVRLTRERDRAVDDRAMQGTENVRLRHERDEWKARAETAEAEVERLGEWCTSLREENDTVRRREGALLEHLRAAEKLVEAARDYVDNAMPTSEHPLRPLFDALATYDAAKEGK